MLLLTTGGSCIIKLLCNPSLTDIGSNMMQMLLDGQCNQRGLFFVSPHHEQNLVEVTVVCDLIFCHVSGTFITTLP